MQKYKGFAGKPGIPRNEKGSIITSNLLLKQGKEVFNDVVLTTAMVDRLACKACLLDMTGESCRIRETKE